MFYECIGVAKVKSHLAALFYCTQTEEKFGEKKTQKKRIPIERKEKKNEKIRMKNENKLIKIF